MKKKPTRDIPNFSRAPIPKKGAPAPQLREQAHGNARAQVVKPKTVTSKAGRRGQ